MAEVLERLQAFYGNIMGVKVTTSSKGKEESDKLFLSSLGKKDMFLSFLGPNKMAISKSMLVFLGYDPEEMAVEIVKFKAFFYE